CTFALEYTVDVTCGVVQNRDTDEDGIPDYLDLDSDNDGIPDNIEAQPTVGYVIPNGVFDANGVDTAYTGGLTPVDTDNDGSKDYLETDSDNDGILDNIEANLVLSGTYGTNGLDNNYDNGDNYTDVNGSFDNSQVNNFPDNDSDVFSGGDVDYRDDSFTTDHDGDGINDEVDLDDDNDGILDAVEIGTCTVNNGVLNWDNEYTEGDTNIANGDDPIITNTTITNSNLKIRLSRTSNVITSSNYRVNDAITTNSSYNLSQRAISGATSRHIFNFSNPVHGLSFTIYDVNQDITGIATDNVQILLTKLDGTSYTLAPADYTTGASNSYNSGTNEFVGTTTGTSNITINSIPAWIVKLQIIYKNDGTGSLSEDQDIAIGNLTFCTPVDSDNDGIFDYIDLDADNDGIPDNIEAQDTQNYIAPSGSYNINGIDLAYGSGLTPQNTDGNGDADYLDLDSDDDGTLDIVESGSGLAHTGGRTNGDVGTNGLDNTLDNGDTYADINGSFDNTQTDNFTDTDGDVNNNSGDVDYRDNVNGLDTDGDGIIDSVDIDDDNDGILDTDEDANTDADNNPLTNPTDTDGDGIPNHLDIDADNDGIPDNIEVQTTTGYIAPSGTGSGITDDNNNGLDDNYEVAQGGTDISTTPTNTDNTDNPDYLDSDSDNDGTPDIQENGDSDNTVSGIDTDGDGLDDNFEGSNTNDGFDINDDINTPSTDLPDIDSDVNTDDVDYRDADNDPVSPSYSGNTLWLRADKNVTGGSNVTLWEDQTASLDFIGSGTPDATVTANNLNFNPTITFVQADNDVLTYTGNLNPRTMYIVYKDASTTSWATPFTNNDDIGHGHSDDSQLYNTTNTPADIRNGAEYVNGLATDFLTHARPDNFELHSRIFNSNISNESRTYYVGRDKTQETSRVINGAIAEIILYSDAHTDAKRQEVETYLAIKYGFTLSTTDNSGSIVEGDYILTGGSTKVWDYSANSAYHNDVAGIGRDDAMDLNQFQSKSVNSDAIITIGLGSIAATNLANGNTFNSNKDFLVWGNNNGVINTVTETELICAPEKTIGRTWKIVENGSVGSVQIAVNKSTIDGALTTPNTIKVLKIADDASFTTNVSYVPLTDTTINSENVYAANYDFNGTKYFTYSEINGIFWSGATANASDRWKGGNSDFTTGAPSTSSSDTDKVMIIDAQGTSNHPTLTENAKIECVWIKGNSKLMVQNNQYLEFDEDFILDGELRLIGNGQLLQTHSGTSNVQGNGKLFRDQAAKVPSIYRYHYWSSPVRELNSNTFRVGQVMKDGNVPTSENSTTTDINFVGGKNYDGATGTAGVTPITISSYWIYTNFNDPGDGSAWQRQRETGAINRGQGFSMKSTGQVPQNFTFVGTPNDGSITFNVSGGATSLLGNPYPSALDATDFINTNINEIDGTLYFWEHTGEDEANPASSEGHNLTGYQGGYSQRNLAMGIAANSAPSTAPILFDWEEANVSGGQITQTKDGITTTVSLSNGTIELLNFSNISSSSGNIVTNSNGPGTYTMTVSFNQKVDVESIELFNNVLDTTPLIVTIQPNNGVASTTATITNTASQIISKTVAVSWKDITSFTISSSSPFNLGLNDLKLRKGNLPSLGEGDYHAPNRYIAVGQGFFVSASSTGGTIRFENAQRAFADDNYAGGGSYFYKGRNTQQQTEKDLLPIIKLGFDYQTSSEIKLHRQIGISFKRGNDFGYESGYDSEIYDIKSTDIYWKFPELDKKLIISGVGEITNQLEIPIAITIDTDKPVFLMIDEIKNVKHKVLLEDKVDDKVYDLSQKPVELNLAKGNYEDRFYLKFYKQQITLDTGDNVLNKSLNIFVDQNSQELVVRNNNNMDIKAIKLFNLLGQEINRWDLKNSLKENRLSVKNLPSTIYIVKVLTNEGVKSKKIIIE
ncbi:MAG: T9SS type A sorting domain-containing protein, partial [Flavobacteriaceae bacterium]|nr:T9SS type A sorting domain-containing protein [Flavobacteriaceae bacterium]